MNLANLGSLADALPACGRGAAVCPALEGGPVTCPGAQQRTCPALAAIRRMLPPGAAHAAP